MSDKRITWVEVVVGSLSVVFIVWLVSLPRLERSGGLSKRAVCAANVRCIGQSCKIYANDFNEAWPIAPFAPGASGGAELSPIGTHRLDGHLAHDKPSVGQCFWILIKAGNTTNKQFICPSSPDTSDNTANPMTYYDFETGLNLSYGYAYPYVASKLAPGEWCDPGQPMITDKCFASVGKIRREGQDVDFNNWLPSQWRPFNSTHHSGEGQNVLYQDGHCSFEKTPACGLPRDEYPVGTSYQHLDLIYENANGILAGTSGCWPVDGNDSVIAHSP
ncbi:MAG: hypothetical protein JXQ73_05860 [Phycisphaerae bacterium]|nr:hypothetical protein [Phycisphaerae bacterium]